MRGQEKMSVWVITLDLAYKLPKEQIEAGQKFAVQWPNGEVKFGIFNDPNIQYELGNSELSAWGDMIIKGDRSMETTSQVSSDFRKSSRKRDGEVFARYVTHNPLDDPSKPPQDDKFTVVPNSGKTIKTKVITEQITEVTTLLNREIHFKNGGSSVVTNTAIVPGALGTKVNVGINVQFLDIPNEFFVTYKLPDSKTWIMLDYMRDGFFQVDLPAGSTISVSAKGTLAKEVTDRAGVVIVAETKKEIKKEVVDEE
jgi:hypothetical protein